ncbi:hypothetical protein AAC387_Pa03g1469 [Persea americana]
MDSINSFKGYGKVNEAEELAFRKKTRRRVTIITISIVLLAIIVVGAVIGTVIHKRNKSSNQDNTSTSSADSIQAICSVTQYKESCSSSLAAIQSSDKRDPEELFRLSLKIAMNELSNISTVPDSLAARANDARVRAALNDCKVLFDSAIGQLNDSLSLMQPGSGEGKILSNTKLEDIRTWLSSAVTDQETCLDGLSQISVDFTQEMQKAMKNSTVFASNCLAIATKILSILEKFNIPIHRKLLAMDFPIWVSAKDRKLLQETNPTPNVIVDPNGGGDFKTIAEAVASVPKKNTKRYVIYVKQGIYKEKVELDKSMWNVMMYGDGKNKTIVTGRLNFRDGTPTFSTATFVAVGRGFIARDMGIENTAGPEGEQAVAFRSGSDRSVFYRCSFNAFQDTLYSHSNRQFYRDCDISGTVDFIFGNAAVVYQGCNILPRQPGANQKNTITAQGKKDPNQNTGISIQQCRISQFDSNMTAPTYLGRPWKEYSTTVIMQTAIGGFLHPAGWLSWTGDNTEPPKTIFYAEYMNSGPGSNVANRVKWSGFNAAISEDVASKYTVDSFIQGSEWLPDTGVKYGASL